MSEYICECDEYRSSWGETYKWATEYREPIVRCRDCKYLEANKYGYEIAEDDCGCIYWDADFALGVAPDGFCAWGERRDE